MQADKISRSPVAAGLGAGTTRASNAGRHRLLYHLSLFDGKSRGLPAAASAEQPTVRSSRLSAEKPCAFCGCSDRKITKEHVWPNWVRDLFPPGPNTVAQHRHNETPRQYVVLNDMGITVNEVCELCNNGWMKRLEDGVQPVLEPCIQHGRPCAFSPSQQFALFQWATKTAFVVDLVNKPDRRYFAASDRRQFHDARSVESIEPYVWIAAHHWRDSQAIGIDGQVWFYDQEEPQRSLTHLYHMTMTLGYFAFQVLFARRPPDHRGRPIPQRVGPWDTATTRIIPAGADAVSWPPAFRFDDATIPTLIERWLPLNR
jgi:hypothetical protein